MKVFLSSILLTFFAPTVIFAETINTGNAYVNTSVSTNANDGSVHSNVTTNIESSGDSSVSIENTIESHSNNGSSSTNNTYKKIEVNVNGEKKVIESHEPGETKIEIGTQTKTPTPTYSPTPTPITITPTITPSSQKINNNISSWVKHFLDNLFGRLFKK